ncbi:MAG: MBL fold metallo-hydrolase [Bacillota bacterium]
MPAPNVVQPIGKLTKVHFIDVGQADSILIVTASGKDILIDGGNRDDGPMVVNYLKKQGVKQLDLIISTHSHEDHIGGLPDVLKAFKVKRIIDSGVPNTTTIYKEYLQLIDSKHIPYETPKKQKIDFGSGIKGYVLGPVPGKKYEELNDTSVVFRLVVGKMSFLFVGDMQATAEADILKEDIASTILKVGHHGSGTSTSDAFLAKVKPKLGVISVGINNDYGHPAASTLKKLANAGVKTYRTDTSGSVVISTDGNTYSVVTGKPSSAQAQGNKSSSTTPPSGSGVKIAAIDLVKEVATITNNSSQDVNMTGWRLISIKGNQIYTFPKGFVLKKGASVRVWSGPNAKNNPPGDLLWSKNNYWNNAGDPGELFNSAGTMVSEVQ